MYRLSDQLMGIIESTDSFSEVVERHAPDGGEIEVLIMETALTEDSETAASLSELRDRAVQHTEVPFCTPTSINIASLIRVSLS